MKKFGISLLLLSIITISIIASINQNNQSVEYLRIHIRANSNSQIDQSVKYSVKEAIVNYLTPYVANCKDKKSAIKTLNEQKSKLEEVADNVLYQNGFTYKSKVAVRNELFPTRVYGDFTLEEGFYDALIVYLGEAQGENWWCVVYPPLCFTATKNVKYKSKILEIIKEFENSLASQ